MNPMQELSIKLLEYQLCHRDYEDSLEKKKEILAHVKYMLEEAHQDGYEKGYAGCEFDLHD